MSDTGRRDGSGAGASRRAGWVTVALRVAALAAVAVCLVLLLAPGTYRVPRGSVTFQLRPAVPGGRIVMPLGPAGVLALESHRTPVDVSVDYRLPDEVPTLSEAEQLLRGLPEFQTSARAAFQRFVSGKALWLLGLGAGVGLLIAGPRRSETALLAAGFGAAGALALGGAFALLTLATVDHTPEVRYEGLASNVPRLLPLLRGLEAQEAGRLERLSEYVEGLQLVALDLQPEVEGTVPPADVRRVLLFSDLHTNVYGMRYAARLARGGGDPVDLVLVAGDVTDGGTREEAELFLRLFTPPEGVPVLMIGGNHEDRPAMEAFAGSDFTVLDWEAAAAAGLTVYGVSDPVAESSQVDSDDGAARPAGRAARDPVARARDARRADGARRPPGGAHDRARRGGRRTARGRLRQRPCAGRVAAGLRRPRRPGHGRRLRLRRAGPRRGDPLHVPAARLLARGRGAPRGRDLDIVRAQRAHQHRLRTARGVGAVTSRSTGLGRVAAALGLFAARLLALARAVRGRRPTLARFEEYARGVAVTAAAFNGEAEPETEGLTALLVSDLHANLFGAALAARLARGDLLPVDIVLIAGDVTDGGSREEALLVARLLAADGGPPALLVGGNHDGAAALDALGASGFELPERVCVERAGLRVYGASDPLARSPAVDSDPVLLAAQARELAASWPPPGDPEVLLVHDVRQAEQVVALAEGRGAPLVVACGNDHRAAVVRRGPVTIVNAGTAGASGYGALGRGEPAAYTAQLLHFGAGPHRRLRRVTTLSYWPGGRSTAVVEPIGD